MRNRRMSTMVGRLSLDWCLISVARVKMSMQKQQRKSPQSTASVMKARSDDWPSNSRARLMVMRKVRQAFVMFLALEQGELGS